jgi:dihydroorotate dehydrogenase
MTIYRLARPLLYRFDAETTHDRAISGLARLSRSPRLLHAVERIERFEDPRLRVTLFGHSLDNPLAVAAGLDKNGVAVSALSALGYAYVEVGTVTPRPQPGNEKPRVFRLAEDRALVNRMGFPGQGMEAVADNLAGNQGRSRFALNVGPNKDRIDYATEDVLAVIERLAELRPVYIAVNVSSPNTARLRDLQGKEALRNLLEDVVAGRSEAAARIPLLIKIAPDLTDSELDEVLLVVTELDLQGVVATNTTIMRPDGLRSSARHEAGGLSGAPLGERSTGIITRVRQLSGPALTIIGAGGVFDGADALDKIGAGATIVQSYTGMIFEGPGMAKRVKREMTRIMERQGIGSLDLIRGTGYRAPRS